MKQFLTFQLANVNYGIHIMDVREIRSFEKPTKMVSADKFVRGVLDLRGEIVPIVSLRDKFNLPETNDESSIVIIVNYSGTSVGIMVDTVSNVHDIDESKIQPPEKVIELPYVEGLYTDKDNSMIVLVKTSEFVGLSELIEV